MLITIIAQHAFFFKKNNYFFLLSSEIICLLIEVDMDHTIVTSPGDSRELKEGMLSF